MPQLGRVDQPIQYLRDVGGGAGRGGIVGQPALEQSGDHRDTVLGALLRQENAVDGFFQLGRAFQAPDIVVLQRASQLVLELRRQCLHVDVERLQIGVEVFAGAVHGFRVQLGQAGPVPRQLADIGEGRQQLQFGGRDALLARRQLVPQRDVAGHQRPPANPADVVPADHRAHRAQPGGGLGDRVAFLVGHVDRVELHPGHGGRGRGFADLIDPQQRRTGVDLRIDHREHFPDPARVGRPNRGLHLHRLEHDQRLADLDFVTRRDRNGDHDGRCRCPDHATLVLTDLVRDAGHFDQVAGRPGDRDDVIPPTGHDQPALVVAESVHLDPVVPIFGLHPVPARPGLADPELVGVPLIAELDRTADHMAGPWPTTPRRGQERGALACLLGVVTRDRRGDQGDVGHRGRARGRSGAGAVQPAGVGRAVDQLGAVEQIEQEGLGRGAAVEHHGGLAEGGAEPSERLAAISSPSDDLGDHRVVIGRDHVTLRDAGVHPQTGTERELQQRHRARRGCEPVVGVLGVESGLDRMAEFGRAVTGQPAAGCHVDLQLDQVQPGGGLGDRVLDLESGVHLQEGENLLLGLIEVLDGGRAAISGGADQLGGHRTQVIGLLLGHHRRGRLLDHLLVLALDRAVAHPGCPYVSMTVGDDLNFDVPGVGDQPLDEYHRVAEGPLRLALGAFQGQLQLVFGVDLADAAAAATAAGLDDQGVADRLRMATGVRPRGYRSAGPGRDRHADLLREQLGLDLVTEQPHRVGGRADEGDPEIGAHLGERRILRDEAPADPHRVGPSHAERAGELGVIQIRTRRGRGRPQGHRLVGLADEHRPALGLGVQCDGDQARTRRVARRPVLRLEFADRADQAHGCFTTVDHCNPFEHVPHIVRRGYQLSRPGARRAPDCSTRASQSKLHRAANPAIGSLSSLIALSGNAIQISKEIRLRSGESRLPASNVVRQALSKAHSPPWLPAGSRACAHGSAMYFGSRYSAIPSVPASRPRPDSLTPPNGAATSETTPRLTPTMPASSASDTRSARSRSRV